MNFWDVCLLAVIAGGAALALLHLRKKKKTGCAGLCSCCGSNCPHRGKSA